MKKNHHNRYQIGIRIAVIAALLFFIAFSFGLELYFNYIR